MHYAFCILHYCLMNVFVTTPSSVFTRTKYMPLARPLTLMRMGE